MSELEWITIKGFKSIRSIEKLSLAPRNVVVGANGSGKSNFLEAFSFLRALKEGKLSDYVSKAGGADDILFFGSKETASVHMHIAFEGEVNQYEVTLSRTDTDELVPTNEVAYFWDKSAYNRPYSDTLHGTNREAGISSASAAGVRRYIRDHFERWRAYHFHDTSKSSSMRKSSEINDNDSLRFDAANLASFLYLLKENHSDSYSMIRRVTQRVAPFFDDFRLTPLRLNPNKISIRWSHKQSDAYFDASSFSDGTLRFIAVATLLLQPVEYMPSVILIDEPELGLHPYAIGLLAALIKQASISTQVIASTQSSLLLDHFAPDDVLVAERQEQATVLRRLEKRQLSSWLDNYSLGQLWEKNEFGGRPG